MTKLTLDQTYTNGTITRVNNDISELYRLSNRLQSTQGDSGGVDSDLLMRRMREMNETVHNQYQTSTTRSRGWGSPKWTHEERVSDR